VSGVPSEVAVFGGGYDPAFDDVNKNSPNTASPMGRAIFMVDLVTGSKYSVNIPSDMTYPVGGDVLLFDVNGDGVFDRGYAGDVGGNMWRIGFDFVLSRLFDSPTGLRIFSKPDAVLNAGSVTVYFGTGDRTNPMRTDQHDRFYAVRDDNASNLAESGLVDVTDRVTQPGSAERRRSPTTSRRSTAGTSAWRDRREGTGGAERVLQRRLHELHTLDRRL
jgi:type IV pilus assembly protein PilY1